MSDLDTPPAGPGDPHRVAPPSPHGPAPDPVGPATAPPPGAAVSHGAEPGGATGPGARADGSLPGPLALIGGGEWSDGCTFDEELWESSGRAEVVVLPTGDAYQHPERSVEAARAWFARMGATVRGLDVLSRPDAADPAAARAVAEARFIYLSGGSPLHMRSVLKDTVVWDALVAAWGSGAVVAGTSAGAMVLGDPMVDPRGGALTIGLGLVRHVAVVPALRTWSVGKRHRTVALATGGLRIVGVDEATALIRDPDGSWRGAGAGRVTVHVDGAEAEPSTLDA